jgi:hypothetical protein
MPKTRRHSAAGEDDAHTVDAEGDVPAAEFPTAPEAESEALGEVNQALTRFKKSAQREKQRFADATDSEYWVALCFQTREQKEEFLRKIGWQHLGDQYLNGMLCAEAQGITLTSRIPPMPRYKIDRRYAELVLPDTQP